MTRSGIAQEFEPYVKITHGLDILMYVWYNIRAIPYKYFNTYTEVYYVKKGQT